MKPFIRGMVLTAALVSAAGTAHPQAVEFRIVERNGRTVATPTEPVMNFVVQARVVDGAANVGLGEFGCKIVATGEPDTFGALDYLLTSNANGTYNPNPTNVRFGPGGSYSGLAAQYTWLAGVSPDFNGVINASVGGFTNTPDNQEIGLLGGIVGGMGLLAQTDLNHDGNPDTYPGTGTTAPLDPAYASTYMGAGGAFVDIYRFRYSVGVFQPRSVTFSLMDLYSKVSDHFVRGMDWRAATTNASSTGATIAFSVVPAPASIMTFGVVACSTIVLRGRRRTPTEI